MKPRLAGLIACLCLVAPALSAQQPTFATKIEAVRVDVLVTDHGQPVRGLGPDDFEITDNGVRQQADLVSFEQIPLNVILALDMSESLAGDRLDELRKAGDELLGGLRNDDQAALVTFSHIVRLGKDLTSQVAAVRTALDEAAPSGETALIDGTYSAIMLGQSDVGRSLVIVFSDGVDTASWLTSEAVLETAKRSDAVVYAISLESTVTPEFLRDMTALTGGRLFTVEKTANLGSVFTGILNEFRQRYLVSYIPHNVAKDGWHKLDVQVKNRRVTIKARPGYLAAPDDRSTSR